MIYPHRMTDYADVYTKLNAQCHTLERRENLRPWVIDLICVVAVVALIGAGAWGFVL